MGTHVISSSGATSTAVDVPYAVSADDRSGATSVNAADFPGGVYPSGTVTLPAGGAPVNLVIAANPDATVEPDETYKVTLGAATGITFSGGRAVAYGTIGNDDTAVVAPLAFENFSTYNNGLINGQGAWVGTSDDTNNRPTVVTIGGLKYLDMLMALVNTVAYNTAKAVPASEAKYAAKVTYGVGSGVAFGFGFTASRQGLIVETLTNSANELVAIAYAYNGSSYSNLGNIRVQLTSAEAAAEIELVVQVSGNVLSVIANGKATPTMALNTDAQNNVGTAGFMHVRAGGPSASGNSRLIKSIAIYAPTATIDWNYAP